MEAEILKHANILIEHFGQGRIEAYFDCFTKDASFLFYNHKDRLTSRSDYETLFESWRREVNFEVLSCRSTNQMVQILGDTAIFLHDVTTKISISDEISTVFERESIVFQRQGDGRWLACHEHLSARPTGDAA